METLLWIAGLVGVWAVLGIDLTREDERIVKIVLGKPYGFKGPGLFWIPYGFAWVRRYTTKVVELQFAQRDENGKIVRSAEGKPVPAGGFITRPGQPTVQEYTKRVGPINIGVTLSLRFNWPVDEGALRNCVLLLPSPRETDELVDIFQEVIMDATRSVGCKMTYIDIMANRTGFAEQIAEAVRQGQASQLLVKTGLSNSVRVIIDHIDVPKQTLDAIDDEEAMRLQAEGVRRKAEGDRDRLKLEGEGHAAAYREIRAEGEAGLQLDAHRTLREMAGGQATKIFFPMDGLRDFLENIFKGKRRS